MLSKRMFAVVLFLVTARAEKSTPLNIVEEAQKFIDRLNTTTRGRIDSWGYSKDYAFWTEQQNVKNESEITGKVESLICISTAKSPHSESIVEASACEEVSEWYIADGGLQTPFDLPVDVTVPMITNRSRQTININVNNQTKIQLKFESKYKSGKVRKIRKMCPITANVVFQGNFAFHYSKVYQDRPTYNAVSVTRLNNTLRGLHKKGRSLVHVLKGTYKEILCRKPRTKKN